MILLRADFVIKTCYKAKRAAGPECFRAGQGGQQFKEGACDMPRALHFLCEGRVRPHHLNLQMVVTEKGGSESQKRAELRAWVPGTRTQELALFPPSVQRPS